MPGRALTDESKIKRGYGIVDMSAPWKYEPWIHVRELSSGSGRRHVVSDLKYPERKIHLLSDLELSVYYMLRQNLQVLELFEQYPLDLERTLEICEEVNVRHPVNPKKTNYSIMTTDFLAVVSVNGVTEYRAYAVKTTGELRDVRVLEKLKIEQLYWNSKNVPWSVITEQHVEKRKEVEVHELSI